MSLTSIWPTSLLELDWRATTAGAAAPGGPDDDEATGAGTVSVGRPGAAGGMPMPGAEGCIGAR